MMTLKDLQDFIDVQAEDPNLWLIIDPTPSEAYLQKALRQLHMIVEDFIEQEENK